jgi:hypothetical protein
MIVVGDDDTTLWTDDGNTEHLSFLWTTAATSLPTADLLLNKTWPSSVYSGDIVTYSLTLYNDWPWTWLDVQLVESYATGFSYLTSSVAPSSWDYFWDIGDLASGATWNLTITGVLMGISGVTYENVAHVVASNEAW